MTTQDVAALLERARAWAAEDPDEETRAELDAIVAEAGTHGWTLMFADRHPYAGGPQHYAAFLHNQDGYELEIVAPNN